MKKVKVLIVEDEPIIAVDLEDRLLDMGYDVAGICSSGEAALHLFSNEDIDLVLMDIQLEGDLDGIQTAQRMRAMRPVHIIYLTSNSDEATFQRAKKTQPEAFLSKPFRGKDLNFAIDLAFNRQEPDVPAPDTGNNKAQDFQFNDRIFVKVKDQMLRFYLADILWFEAEDYYCKMITRERGHLITDTLKQMEESLAANPNFLRAHRSYLINLSHIEAIGEAFVLIYNTQIPINKRAKEEIIQRVQKL